MKRALFALGAAIAIGGALVACDSILGIDEFPDLASDAASVDAGVDATIDGAVDAPVDATIDASPADADSGDDGAADAPDDQHVTMPCVHPCVVGDARCVGADVLQTCVPTDAGCELWDDGFTCGTGGTCWGAPNQAYCCTGTTAECAPSCHVITNNPNDGGNGQTNCGRSGTDGCCTTIDVNGGSFLRSYDGVVNTDDTNPATVSTFALDKYEVTVGRFRRFVNAWVNLWRPQNGAGIHTHLNGGQGLVDSSGDGGTYEQGWDTEAWNALLPTTQAEWDVALQCDGTADTWTTSPGATEAYPINCVTWEEAYAFCIWDGAFLPSETEWNYAGSAGSDQRVFAWSNPSTSETLDCTYANYDACGDLPGPVGADPNGNGRWGHADLTGSMWEWTLDSFATYVNPCVDCAYLATTIDGRTMRGASFNYPANALYVQTRGNLPDTTHYGNDGFRCARPP